MITLKKTFVCLLLSGAYTMIQAHDFVVTLNNQNLYFNIKDKKAKTVEITYDGSITKNKPTYIDGEVTIPARVSHNDTSYTIVGVSSKAFCGADKLTGITLPASIKSIGDFAFEGCTSLRKIIFPGRKVDFGQGVFFKCTSIKNVTLGSDWTDVDLKMFRWSDSLTTLFIPAKIEKIQNLKSLKHLTSVTVDTNNAKFSATNGVLYNKDGKILYGCPRAYQGKLRIQEGTETITTNALIDCPSITQIDFPSTLKTLSFREMSRMKNLADIIFRGKEPVNTAVSNGKEVFLLQVANANVNIQVLNDSKKAYKDALVQTAGEFSNLQNPSVPYTVKADEMPNAKKIVGVKNFSKSE